MLKFFLQILGSVAAWFQNRQLIKAGEAQAELAVTKEIAHDIQVANEVRDVARAANARVVPADSLPDDGFRRD